MKHKNNDSLLMIILMMVMSLSASFSFMACSDDDDEKSEAQQQQEAAEQQQQFWDVVGQLVAAGDYTPDYEGKQFEPVIGEQDATNPMVRVVATNSAQAAAERFASLVGASDIDENTQSFEWKADEVGTMSYRKVTDGTAWAEVEVNIPSVPRLQKIVYRSVEQGYENGSFNGSAYYRFGDVVSRVRPEDNVTEYWVCVRPAFGPEGKTKTHWVSVSPLPKKNIWSYPGSNNKDYALPTGLKYDTEHMQNLAELLFAMCYPKIWEDNIGKYSSVGFFGPSGMKIFHDFHSTNADYHNQEFWRNVAGKWDQFGLFTKIFGEGKSLTYFKQNLDTEGLYLLYKGYSWHTKTSNNATLYQAHYVNTPNSKNANMQTKKPLSEVTAQMIDKSNPENDIVIDVSKLTAEKPFLLSYSFFGDSKPRWIVRYATGAELSSTGRYDNYRAPIDGVNEEYRYYRDMHKVTDLEHHDPEKTESMVGRILASDGLTYAHVDSIKNGSKPMGIVVHYGLAGTAETDLPYRGLAIGLEPIKAMKWGDYKGCEAPIVQREHYDQFASTKDGYSVTLALWDGCDGKKHEHPAAEVCNEYMKAESKPLQKIGFSGWFIPSVGQWILALENMGLTWQGKDRFGNDYKGPEELITRFYMHAGLQPVIYTGQNLWTSTLYDEESVYTILFDHYREISFPTMKKKDYLCTFPFIAFK